MTSSRSINDFEVNRVYVLNNFYSQFVFASTVFLLVFFDSQEGISLRGEVNRVCMVDNQRRRGAAIVGFGSC